MRTAKVNFGDSFQDVGNILATRPKAYAAAGDVYPFDLSTARVQRTNASAMGLLKQWFPPGERANTANLWIVGGRRREASSSIDAVDSRAATVSRMRALRSRAIAGGMRLKTLDEINEDVREMRGER